MHLKTIPQAIGNRVRQARLAKNWSVAELARRAGVSRGNVWLLERQDGQCPTPRTMAALADVLEVDRAWLFFVVPTTRFGSGSAEDNEKVG